MQEGEAPLEEEAVGTANVLWLSTGSKQGRMIPARSPFEKQKGFKLASVGPPRGPAFPPGGVHVEVSSACAITFGQVSAAMSAGRMARIAAYANFILT